VITKPAAFRVFGEPAPKGSMIARQLKGGRTIVVEDNARTKPWRRVIEHEAPAWFPEKPAPHQPLKITLVFGVTRTAAAADRTHPAVRANQGVGGDLDKLVRLALDALESCGVLTDDAQVVELVAAKQYADQADPGLGRAGMYCRIEPATPVLGHEMLPLVVPHG
jgi:Holliday junction resolvase RusA-like endonuclease